MKKKIWIPIVAAVVLLAVLFVPIPQESYDDGGTREWTALTHKIVDWNRISNDGIYEKTRIYWGEDKNKSIDELWDMEWENVEHSFIATVLEVNGNSILVEPVAGEGELQSSDQISFSAKDMDIGAKVGDVVKITYIGGIMESYPARVNAVKWEIVKNEMIAGADAPNLTLVYGAKTYEPMRGSYSWAWDKGNGEYGSINADSMHPTDAKEYMPEVMFFVSPLSSVNPHQAYLSFDVKPTEIYVRGWQITDWEDFGNAVDIKITPHDGGDGKAQYALELKDVPCVYDIVATWDFGNELGGTVTYCFYTAENPVMDWSAND